MKIAILYEFFKGTDSSGNPMWTKDINSMEPVFKDNNKVEWGTTAFFHPVFKTYWLIVRHDGKSGRFGIFDAPEPWGPWTTISYGTDFPTWVYTPTGSASRPAYMHSFPVKWIRSDIKTMWSIFDREDQFNIAKVTVEKLL
jgi:hypothetical protein